MTAPEEILPTPFVGGGMSGPDHYETAEELLQYASDEVAEDYQFAQLRLMAAQVHATLALAAATALSAPQDAVAWYAVASVDSTVTS